MTSSFDPSNPAPLEVKVTHINNMDHLKAPVMVPPLGVFQTNICPRSQDTAAVAELDDTRKFFAGATIVRK